MSSKVQMCNLALAELGGNTITALTDNTSEAKRCNLIFDEIAEEVMAAGEWTSTIARASLASTTNTPAYGFDKEYQLPVDPKMLKVLEINEGDPGNYAYRIEGDKLLTDLTSVKIRYISKLTSTESYDVNLRTAIIARLVAALAYFITGDRSLAQASMEKYKMVLQDELAKNGQQGSADTIGHNSLDEIR